MFIKIFTSTSKRMSVTGVSFAIAAVGLYCLYYSYHPLFQPFQLGISVSSSRVDGHILISRPLLQCVEYNSTACAPLCKKKGSDCERARCKALCLKQELKVAYACFISTESGISAQGMEAIDLYTARTRASAKNVCEAVFPLHSVHTVYKSFKGLKLVPVADLNNRLWLGYALLLLSLGIWQAKWTARVFHAKKN